MKISFALVALGGILLGLSCIGGWWALLALFGLTAFILAYLLFGNSRETTALPVIASGDSSSEETTIGRIVQVPKTAAVATLQSVYSETPEEQNSEARVRLEEIWAQTESDLSKAIRDELETISRLENKSHTVAFFMLNSGESIYTLRTAVGHATHKLKKNASFGSNSGLLGRLFLPEIPMLLEGELPSSNALQIYEETLPVKSLAVVHVMGGNSRYGVLLVDSLVANAFNEKFAETLSLAAKTLQFLCRKAFMSAKNYIKQEQFSAMYNYQKKFFQTMAVKDIYEQIGEYVKENISYERFMILALDPHDELYGKIVYSDGLDADYFLGRDFKLSDTSGNSGLLLAALARNYPTNFVERNITEKNYIFRISRDEPYNSKLRYMYAITSASDAKIGETPSFLLDFETDGTICYTDHEKKLIQSVIVTASFALERAFQYERGKDLAMKDGLTGLFNHRTMHERLRSEKLRADRQKINIGILMMDIDHFKSVNDTYGHPAGDEIIKGIARTICGEIRAEIDIVARYGGEEFVVALIDTSADSLKETAERIRQSVEKTPFDIQTAQPLSVTVSVGVYLVEPSSRYDMKDAISFADDALYKAKKSGRNRVVEYRFDGSEDKQTSGDV